VPPFIGAQFAVKAEGAYPNKSEATAYHNLFVTAGPTIVSRDWPILIHYFKVLGARQESGRITEEKNRSRESG